jgi:hypothetical protein
MASVGLLPAIVFISMKKKFIVPSGCCSTVDHYQHPVHLPARLQHHLLAHGVRSRGRGDINTTMSALRASRARTNDAVPWLCKHLDFDVARARMPPR